MTHSGQAKRAILIAPLASQVAAGFSLMLLQSVAGKAITAVGQVILAWYLGPAEFGLIGLVYTVSVFVGLIQQAGLREILVRRSRSYERWANVSFWMSLVTGSGAALLTIFIAPFAAHLYGAEVANLASNREQLVPLLHVVALAMPFNALAIVPMAKLQIDLRFRAITGIAMGQGVCSLGLSCILAAQGFGAYSFVLPLPLVAAAVAAISWYLARPPVRRNPQIRKWRYVIWESSKLILAGAFIHSTLQGGAFALGVFHHDDATVGVFWFAFGLSLQIIHLLTFNLGSVLFPALSRLGADPLRQRLAFVRAVRLLLLIGVPMCFLQAVTAEPFLRALFDFKWLGAIVPLQLLSFGMAFNLATGPSINFLLTLGQTNTVLKLSVASAFTYLALVTAAASVGGASAVAGAVAIHAFLFGHAYLAAAFLASKGLVREVAPIFIKPICVALGAVFPGWLLYIAMPPGSRLALFASLAFFGLTAIVSTAIMMRRLAPAEFIEMTQQIRARLRRHA